MLGGFLKGVLAAILGFIAVILMIIWIFSGFYNPILPVISIVLFIVAAFLSYVSRQTVRPGK